MHYNYYSTLINYKNSTIMSSEKTTEALYKQMEEIENGRESAWIYKQNNNSKKAIKVLKEVNNKCDKVIESLGLEPVDDIVAFM